MPVRSLSIRPRRALVAVLLLALALTQTLGAVHRMLSGHAARHQSVAASAGVAAGVLESLFAGHDSERDCKVFDQSTHADLAWGEVAASSVDVGVEMLEARHAAWQIASQAAGYLARGPPRHA
jgi:hypothetical protein